MRRILSLILVMGLVLNIVIPVYATEAVGDDPAVGGFWKDLAKGVDFACAVLGVSAIATKGVVCAFNPVATGVCVGCAVWAVYRATGALLGE
jgi:hypothetical protein